MKKGRKVLRTLFTIVVLLLFVLWVFVRYLQYRAVPDYDKDLVLSGLKDQVTVYRDSLGIPHVYARNEPDLYLVTGYLMAQDRMWQMDLLRRVTQGRLSEIFGRDFVQTDQLLRALNIPAKSKRILDSLKTQPKESLEAFAMGINEYLNDNKRKLPPEFAILGYKPEPWKPENTLNVIGYMAWDLSGGNYSAEVLLEKIRQKMGQYNLSAFFPDSSRINEDLVYPHFQSDTTLLALFKGSLLEENARLEKLGVQAFHGSNNWAVDPEKSLYEKPILANDMHLGLNLPGIWYQIHQVVEGSLNVTGVAIPGEPLVVAGHNEDIAWGMTNLYVDDIDLFLEKTNPEDSLQYFLDGDWKTMEVRKELIPVKGGDTVSIYQKYTVHGPVISGLKGMKEILTMKWIGFDYSNEYLSVYEINRAQNWREFTHALRFFISLSQNFVYADRKGNIGLYAGGGAAIRKGSGLMIRPGDTHEYDWTGRIPLEAMPHSFNPPDHQVSSANNRTAPSDYRGYIGTYYAQNYRIARIRELLQSKEKMDVQDFMRFQADQHSLLAKFMNPLIVQALQGKNIPAKYQPLLEYLSDWDGEMAPGLVAPTLFESIYRDFILESIRDEAGENLALEIRGNSTISRTLADNLLHHRDNPLIDDIRTDERETFADIVVRSFLSSADYLTTRYGEDPAKWNWGRVHTLTLEHPLGKVKLLDKVFGFNKGPFSVGGSFHTVSPYSYPANLPFAANHGASQRHIFVVGDWDKSFTVIPTGESGIPASEYYGDQSEMYIGYRYHHDYFSKELVIQSKKYETTFLPE